MSTTPWVEVGITRSPSIMIRLRWEPTPRRFRAERPFTPLEEPPLPTVTPVEPIREGSWVTVVKILGLACFCRSSELIPVVGVGASNPPLMMREEETVTDSTPSWAGACACAKAGPAIIMARTAVLLESARRRRPPPMVESKNMIGSPPRFKEPFYVCLGPVSRLVLLCKLVGIITKFPNSKVNLERQISQWCHRRPDAPQLSFAFPGCGIRWRPRPDIAPP